MLNWLRGPRPMNGQDISFLNDRFRDGKTYLPFTYFAGATPDNSYTPSEPFTLTVNANHVSAAEAISPYGSENSEGRRSVGIRIRTVGRFNFLLNS